MGRHTVPGTGAPEPDRGFWVRIVVGVVAVLLVVGYLVVRAGGGNGNDTAGTTAGSSTSGGRSSTPSPTASATGSPSPPTSAPTSPTTSAPPATTPAPATTRPPTLTFTVRYPAYITVRVPGGRTLVSKLYPGGAKATFDQKLLQVVNGRPQAVRFVVNGRPRKQGPAGRTEVFTVQRR